jgi:hypothetical protein
MCVQFAAVDRQNPFVARLMNASFIAAPSGVESYAIPVSSIAGRGNDCEIEAQTFETLDRQRADERFGARMQFAAGNGDVKARAALAEGFKMRNAVCDHKNSLSFGHWWECLADPKHSGTGIQRQVASAREYRRKMLSDPRFCCGVRGACAR